MVNANPDFSAVLEHFAAKGKPEKAADTGMSLVCIKEKATYRAEDAATSRRKGTPMTTNGTSPSPERSNRIDWVDYAKGICIVMVVMMHSVLGVEKAAGDTGFMHAFVMFAQPFRMPDFFLISGLFLAVVIDRD